MTQFTTRFKFPVPDFNTKPWQSNLLSCFQRIDETIFQGLLSGGSVGWTNATAFTAGITAVDTVSGTFWICLISHTSAVGGTFADDRTANPTYWGSSSVAPENRGAWTTATAYVNTDYVTNASGFYCCLVTHTSGVFADDLAAGYWTVLIDLGSLIASIENSVEGIEEFLIIYLGVQAADPTLDNDGNALVDGAMYFNSVTDVLKIYTIAGGWVAITTSAPDTVDYLVKTADAGLSAERVVTDGAAAGQVKWNWSVAGQVKGFLRATAGDAILYATAADTWAETGLSAFSRTLLDDSTAGAWRATLGITNIPESEISFTDITNGNASTAAHGFLKKLSNVATQFMDGQGNWDTVKDSDVAFTDIATGNSDTSNHGYLLKLNASSAHFMAGDGVWRVPPDTVGAPVAGAGITVAGSTVSINTNNTLGVGCYAIASLRGGYSGTVASGATVAGADLTNAVGAEGTFSGTYRNVGPVTLQPAGVSDIWIRVS